MPDKQNSGQYNRKIESTSLLHCQRDGVTRLPNRIANKGVHFSITITLLKLKVPYGATFDTLLPLVPVLLRCVLSFIYVGTYRNKLRYGCSPSSGIPYSPWLVVTRYSSVLMTSHLRRFH